MSALSIGVAAQESPERDALIADGVTLRYAELAARVLPFCALLDELRLGPSKRVALWASNRVETVLAILAFVERGVPFVPLHPRFTSAEAERLARAADPTRIFMEDDLDAIGVAPQNSACFSVEIAPEHPLAILFTSGTTGTPKGAILSRAAFVASAAASAENLGWHDDDRWLLCMPLCHVGGLSILTRCLLARRAVILHARFDPEAVLRAIVEDRATLLSVVPTQLRRLLDADARGDLGRLRAILVGGAAASSALFDDCARRGVRALSTYGLTEACSQVTAQRLQDPPRSDGAGRPLLGVELSIRDDAGHPMSPGKIGRIHIDGPTRLTGYFGHTPLREAFDTGDLGSLDDSGHLHVHARRTDLIVTGGENVYPAEIEEVLESHPGVRRALVFGVPDETWGEIVAAAIEDDAPERDERALEASLAAKLAPWKRPRRVCFVNAIPVAGAVDGGLGKLDRARGRTLFTPQARPWTR